MHFFENMKDLRVTVMGLGLNGGGLASAAFFARQGAKVTVTDLKNAEVLAPSINQLKHFSNIDFVLGEHRTKDFKTADLVIKNPGVKREGNIYLEAAKRVETDISVFLSISQSPLIAVTGSKGKSSTASAVHYGLQTLGYTSFLGGNITVSPLTFIEKTRADTPVVLELSSWQLADLKSVKFFKPDIGIITPIIPDHLNWYGTMEKYVSDKKILYKHMTEQDSLICSYGDKWGNSFARKSRAHIFRYDEKPLPGGIEGAFFSEDGNGYCRIASPKNGKTSSNTLLQGYPLDEIKVLSHKARVPDIKLKQNVLNAALALLIYGVPAKKIATVMDGYSGIAHRMEFFYEANGVEFYNDSASTVPESAAAAVDAFNRPPVLICGGTNKKLNFLPLAESASRAKSLYLLGGSGTDILIKLLNERGLKYYGPYAGFNNLLHDMKSHLEKGDKVVLSPGAASFELFTNEFDRGNQFKERVRALYKE
ncbi:UDP-N-acetylmuramoyl-L-alanine--D-glutamate ligase [Treponema sp. HNW]|uniref:UDP-N-acetylmuramoyl-L-alanine--D-glutamate ligase n=1 Tax=Treponema sp. HNW TaxID=3116654 RepID=UPI003D0EAD87